MHHKRRSRRPVAAAAAMAIVATCIVTFQLVAGPTGATTVDPPSRPGVATQTPGDRPCTHRRRSGALLQGLTQAFPSKPSLKEAEVKHVPANRTPAS
jgi:hypothetical protein